MAVATKIYLLVISSPEIASELQVRLEIEGHEGIIATTSSGLRAAAKRHPRIAGIVVDVKATKVAAQKILAFLRQALPPEAPIYVTKSLIEATGDSEFEESLGIKRLGVPINDYEKVVSRLLPKDEKPQMARYDANVINCFVSSANSVLEYYTQSKPELGKPYILPFKKVPAGYVCAVVTMDGRDVKGAASLSCDKGFLVEIASRISGLSKTEANKNREALLSAATEMADQIFGKTEGLLGKLGFVFTLGAPEIHADDEKEIALKGPAPALIIPFSLKKKRFYIGFSLAISK